MNANAVYTGSMVSSTQFTDYPAIIKAVYQSAGQLAQNALPPAQ